jgi:hypothetical protein
MQMGDYRLDHLVVLTAWKKVGIIGTENRRRFCKNHAWFTNLPVIRGKYGVNPANRYNLHHIEEVCKNQTVHCPLNSNKIHVQQKVL